MVQRLTLKGAFPLLQPANLIYKHQTNLARDFSGPGSTLWMTSTLDAKPLSLYRATVAAEHIDYNGHMNVAFYVLLFDEATDAYKDHVGLDRDYRKRTNCSTFAAELHVSYLSELKLGDKIRVETLLLDHDSKRHHFIHTMYNEADNRACALMEVMSLHVDLETRKVTPFPDNVQTQIELVYQQHEQLPRPKQTGHVMGIRR